MFVGGKLPTVRLLLSLQKKRSWLKMLNQVVKREEDHSSLEKSIFTFFSWELCGCHATAVVKESSRRGRREEKDGEQLIHFINSVSFIQMTESFCLVMMTEGCRHEGSALTHTIQVLNTLLKVFGKSQHSRL